MKDIDIFKNAIHNIDAVLEDNSFEGYADLYNKLRYELDKVLKEDDD